MNKLILLFLSGICSASTFSQTLLWTDNFESLPSGGTRTPEENGGTTPTPSTSYFKLTDGTTVSQVVPFTGKQGTNYWAGEDHNAAGTGFTASGAQGAATNSINNELQIEWTGINISGKSGLSFRGLLAANSTNEPWDNTVACLSGVGTTNTDYIIIEYKIDGGAYTPLARYFNRGSASGTGDKYLFEDTNNDGCGDGAMLTNAFAEITKPLAGTGTTLSLRLRVFCEGNNEEWGVDNFRIFFTSALPVELTSFTAEAKSSSTVLQWSTASELNNDRFEIERSTDGIQFEKIAAVKSNGNATVLQQYFFTDNRHLSSLLFYRLKQVDKNGLYTYSSVISVRPPGADKEIRTFPAPVKDVLTVQLINESITNTSLQLTDINGRKIPVTFSGSGIYRTCNLAAVSNGLYILKITTPATVWSKVIVKQ